MHRFVLKPPVQKTIAAAAIGTKYTLAATWWMNPIGALWADQFLTWTNGYYAMSKMPVSGDAVAMGTAHMNDQFL